MKTLILEIKNGGLGDHLFYSHIPRIAKENKVFNKVLISNHSIFRHPDYKKLVWEMNPYVDGFTDEKGIFHVAEKTGDDENLLDRLMLLYGLDDGTRFHEPEIYYQPALKPELQDKVIFEPNFVSYTGDIANGATIGNWFKQNDIHVDFQMKKLNKRYLGINNIKTIESYSLLDFCSILVSAKKIYSVSTGTPTLAAALKVPVTVFYSKGHLKKYRHSKLHNYVYLVSDYNVKNKVKKWVVLLLKKFMPIGTP